MLQAGIPDLLHGVYCPTNAGVLMSALALLTEEKLQVAVNSGLGNTESSRMVFEVQLMFRGDRTCATADSRAGAVCRPAPPTQRYGEPGRSRRLQGTQSTEGTGPAMLDSPDP